MRVLGWGQVRNTYMKWVHEDFAKKGLVYDEYMGQVQEPGAEPRAYPPIADA